MPLDRAMIGRMAKAKDQGNIGEFARLLRENLQYLRADGTFAHEGEELWLRKAARDGQLHFVKFLVEEMGIGVNEPEDDDVNPEGPIKQAAGNGHLEVVRWLLDHGARINFEIKGVLTSMPLSYAASNGHLDVVKLLVENGAAINAVWKGDNALKWARTYGYEEIADYLVSQGAKMPEELVERDIPGGHAAILQHVGQQKGELNPAGPLVLPDPMPGEPPIAVYVTQPCDDSPMQTVFTLGMSDREIPLGDDLTLRGELAIFLPPDWPLTEQALAEERNNWPVTWMLRIAREAQDSQSWPAPKDPLIMNGNPPQPLTAETEQCGFLCRLEQTPFAEVVLPDNRMVKIVTLFPIYAEEAEFVRQNDAITLAERFLEHELPLYVDPNRPNVAV